MAANTGKKSNVAEKGSGDTDQAVLLTNGHKSTTATDVTATADFCRLSVAVLVILF